MSVSLLREALTGDLLLFYLRKNSLADCQLFLRRSADEGETWGAPRRISLRDGYHVMNNARVVQLASGRLLAPVALTPDYGETRHQNAFCYISDDGGVTWRAGRGSTDIDKSTVGCQEPGLVDLGQRTLMYIRSDQGYVYGAISADGGETWGIPTPFRDLPAPAAPATIARLPGGRLVALYNHRPDGAQAGWADRTPLAAAASDDGGDSYRAKPRLLLRLYQLSHLWRRCGAHLLRLAPRGAGQLCTNGVALSHVAAGSLALVRRCTARGSRYDGNKQHKTTGDQISSSPLYEVATATNII